LTKTVAKDEKGVFMKPIYEGTPALSFNSFQFPKFLELALKEVKFTQPTPVQIKVIPTILQGKDVMICAETGSGKTAAYSLPMLSQLILNKEAQAVILAPTRELIVQIGDFLNQLLAAVPGMRAIRLIGGTDMGKQIRDLRRRPQIILATPGRMIDHLKRRTLDISRTQFLILDEGDRMLDMGFAPQLAEILKHLPIKRQTCLLSATLSHKVRKLAQSYLYQPVQIDVGQISKPVTRIDQKAVEVE
jgi:superfamily II DNA/RNA helicase